MMPTFERCKSGVFINITPTRYILQVTRNPIIGTYTINFVLIDSSEMS